MAETPTPQSSNPVSEPFPQEFPEPEIETDEPYRALAVTALIGLFVALIYTVVVLFPAAVGILSGKPFLMAPWTLAIPLIAIIFCIIAKYQIQRAEGALAGQKLATWGILLSVFVGMGYWSYRTAVYFAIRQQARTYAEQWIDLIKRDELNRAILRTLPPLKQMGLDDEEAALSVELPMHAEPGMIQRVTGMQLVAHIRKGGEKTELKFQGTSGLTFRDGGYQVELSYLATTPYVRFDLVVTAQGNIAPNNEYPGRRWFVVGHRTNIPLGSPIVYTELGEAAERIISSGRATLNSWITNIQVPEEVPLAYLHSLPPEQRSKQAQEFQEYLHILLRGGGGGFLGAAEHVEMDLEEKIPGLVTFKQARFLDTANLQATPKVQNQVKEAVVHMLNPKPTEPTRIQFSSMPQPPEWKHENGIITAMFRFEGMMVPQLRLGGQIVLRGELDKISINARMPNWWVEKVIMSEAATMERDAPPGAP